MEIRVNTSELKGLSKGWTCASMRRGILSITDGSLVIENVPYQGDCEASDVPLQTSRDTNYMKGAGLVVSFVNWCEADGFCPANCEPIQVLTDNLKGSLSWLYGATSRDEGRPNLLGIHIESNSGIVDMVATDGHRLGWDQAINEFNTDNFNVNIRRDVINSALKLAGKKGNLGTMEIYRELEPVMSQKLEGCNPDGTKIFSEPAQMIEADGTPRFKLTRHNVRFTGLPGYYWHDAMINLEYPEFRRIVPAGFRIEPKMCFSALKAFVKVASKVVSKDKTPLCRLRFETGLVSVYVRDGNNEKVEEVLECDYQGETFEIAYNVRYLLEALEGMTGEPDDKIKFYIKGEASASLLIDGDRKAVIMPVRIRQ